MFKTPSIVGTLANLQCVFLLIGVPLHYAFGLHWMWVLSPLWVLLVGCALWWVVIIGIYRFLMRLMGQ
jgi:hypothetical protein